MAAKDAMGHKPSFNHLVRTGEELSRQIEAERLCGLQIDYQLIFRGCLYWQIRRLLTFQDAINVGSRAPIRIDEVGTIRNQATADDKGSPRINCRQTVAGGEFDDLLAVDNRQCAHDYD